MTSGALLYRVWLHWGVAPHVADKILNHQSGTISGVAAVYQRHEFMKERKEALERWGKHVQGLSGSRARAESDHVGSYPATAK